MSCHSWNANLSSRAKFFWGELLEMHIFIVLLQHGFRSPFWNQRNFKLKKFAILKKFDGTWHKRAITSSLLIQCILYILHCHYENSQLPDYFPREINGQYKEECSGWVDIIHVSNEKIGRDINSPDLKTAFGDKRFSPKSLIKSK